MYNEYLPIFEEVCIDWNKKNAIGFKAEFSDPRKPLEITYITPQDKKTRIETEVYHAINDDRAKLTLFKTDLNLMNMLLKFD